MKIYFAAPLFSRAEIDFNASLAASLEKEGIQVLLPQEFCAPIPKDNLFFKSAFDACVAMIAKSDVVVAIVDGPDADSGTCFEMGYAYANNIPIVVVRTDFRASEENGLNLMISQSANALVRNQNASVSELAALIKSQLQTIAGKVIA